MKKRILALLLVSALAPVAATPAAAQVAGQAQAGQAAALQGWQGLARLGKGKKVLVEFKGGGAAEAKFVGVSGDRLSLSDDGSTYTIEQRDIQRVYRLKGRWSRGKAARVGAAVGMLAGTFIGVERMIRNESRPGFTPSGHSDTGPAFAGFFLGAAGGAGVGALVGGKRKGALLYESK